MLRRRAEQGGGLVMVLPVTDIDLDPQALTASEAPRRTGRKRTRLKQAFGDFERELEVRGFPLRQRLEDAIGCVGATVLGHCRPVEFVETDQTAVELAAKRGGVPIVRVRLARDARKGLISAVEWREPPYTREGAGTWLVRYVQPIPPEKTAAVGSREARPPEAPARTDPWVAAVEAALSESQRMLWQLRWKHSVSAPCLSLSGKDAKKVTYAATWPVVDPRRRWASMPTPGRCHPVLESVPVS